MSEQAPFAIGMIETQGLTAVIEAIDTACKAGNVEILGREKLGGGYITVLIKGDVAAVKAAIEAGREKVESAGWEADRRPCHPAAEHASAEPCCPSHRHHRRYRIRLYGWRSDFAQISMRRRLCPA